MKIRKHKNELVNQFIKFYISEFGGEIDGQKVPVDFYIIFKNFESFYDSYSELIIEELFKYYRQKQYYRKVVIRKETFFRYGQWYYEIIFNREELEFIYSELYKYYKNIKRMEENNKKSLLNKLNLTEGEFEELKKLLK